MRYRIRALGAGASLEEFELEAADEAALRTAVARRGVALLSARPVADQGARRGRFPLLLFNQELLALLRAGIPLAEALAALAEKESRPAVARVLAGVLQDLREGRSLAAALAARPEAFPDLYQALIRAAEHTSDLEPTLARYIDYQRQMAQIRDKLIAAATYPALLLLVGGALMLFLLIFVVPRFAQIFESVGGELPWLSQVLLDWGRFVAEQGYLAMTVPVFLTAGAVYVLFRPRGRAWLVGMAWRQPRLRARLRVFELARFYRTLGMLLRGGIPAVAAMGMVDGTLSATLRPGLRAAISALREGRGFAFTLDAQGLATPVALRMLAVGERAGNLGEMLERAAEFHEEENARWLEVFTRLVGPC